MISAMTKSTHQLEQRFHRAVTTRQHTQSFAFSFLRLTERERIERHMEQGGPVGLLLFEVENFYLFQNLYGQEIADKILITLEREVKIQLRECMDHIPLLYLERVESGNIVLVCGDAECDQQWLRNAAYTIRLGLRSVIKREVIKLTGQDLTLAAGYAVLPKARAANLEQAVYTAMCDAQRVARGSTGSPELMQEFREIIDTPLLGVHYQPIVDLQRGEIFSWEALARGPRESNFRSPAVLFDFAEEVEAIFQLEQICRETAIREFGPAGGRKLFLNIHPKTMVDPSFTPGETKRLLQRYGLEPSDVVLEITERHSTRDFTLFHRTLAHYRDEGYKVAVDDVGAGYSGLWSLAEIRPDFLKLDMSLIRGIDTNPVKRALIETLLTFSDKVGCKIIAEGIETEHELAGLVRMGLHYGQGFFLSRPAFPRPEVQPEAVTCVQRSTKRLSKEIKCSVPVNTLVESVHTVDPAEAVGEVKTQFDSDEALHAMVVAKKGRPQGLIMRHTMDRMLSSQYGLALYTNKEATRIMDPSPLVVEADAPVETVAQAAMNRETFKLYDPVVVTRGGQLAGVVSVQKLLDALASVQVEMAKGANPLTGLPGNVAIEREIEKRCARDDGTSFIYADLDNFKVYNDKYGFKDGDNILLLTSRILTWAMRKYAGEQAFTGHVGGDDFFMALAPENAERVCQAITRCFKRLVRHCYTDEDRARGYVEGKDRNGEERTFGFISISLAIVDTWEGDTIHTVAHRAAGMKKYAKSKCGNVYVRDRRGSKSEEGECEPSVDMA